MSLEPGYEIVDIWMICFVEEHSFWLDLDVLSDDLILRHVDEKYILWEMRNDSHVVGN